MPELTLRVLHEAEIPVELRELEVAAVTSSEAPDRAGELAAGVQ